MMENYLAAGWLCATCDADPKRVEIDAEQPSGVLRLLVAGIAIIAVFGLIDISAQSDRPATGIAQIQQ